MTGTFQEIGLDQIRPSPFNPRDKGSYSIKDADFARLVESIEKVGVIEPVIVRPVKKGFELVAGERRFRALAHIAKQNGGLAGATIPAIVRELTDDEAFDLTTIENLDRKDLNPLEEAQGFAAWVKRHGKDALKTLAERTGISLAYIQKRVALMDLPAEVLKAWGDGRLKVGHLEQFMRLQSPEKVMEVFERVVRPYNPMRVMDLKNSIDNQSPELRKARFDTSECADCPRSSTFQRSLFGEDLAGKEGLCLDPDCFREKYRAWWTENWADSRHKRDYGTTSWRFGPEISWTEFEMFHRAQPACRGCDNYVSILAITGEVRNERVCVGDKNCFARVMRGGKDSPGSGGKTPEEKRSEQHGLEFRERFYRAKIEGRVNELDGDDDKALRIALFALLKSSPTAWGTCREQLDIPFVERHRGELFRYLEGLTRSEIVTALKTGGLSVILRMREGWSEPVDHVSRRFIGEHLGIDLASEWRIDADYLKAKTIKEILALGEELGVFEDPAAQAFLYETLAKKRGRFDSCKKAELVKVFLESGVDLAGRVPREILGENVHKNSGASRDDGGPVFDEQVCRVCGCTRDNPCEGGCFWVEDDLCSACAAE